MGIPEGLGDGERDDGNDKQAPLENEDADLASVGETVNEFLANVFFAVFFGAAREPLESFNDFLPTLLDFWLHRGLCDWYQEETKDRKDKNDDADDGGIEKGALEAAAGGVELAGATEAGAERSAALLQKDE